MKIVVGLGNPGLKYKNNRHNAGFMVLDEIAKRQGVIFKKSFIYDCYLVKVNIEGGALLLVKPLTYMNNSGRVARKIVARYKPAIEDLLVVYDDADLEPGMLRYRKSGSSAGHQGLASIIAELHVDTIPRLKIGIGKNSSVDLVDYVLSDFSSQEKEIISEIIYKAASACIDWAARGSEYVIKNYSN